MSPLVVVITSEQLRRLNELCESSGFSQDEQIGGLIDLDWEEWKEPDDARLFDVSRSTRFAKFARLEASSKGGAK